MFKWFKKHSKKLIIATSILTACVCGLFGFTKSYAYDYNNGHLVGNNLLDYETSVGVYFSTDQVNTTPFDYTTSNISISYTNDSVTLDYGDNFITPNQNFYIHLIFTRNNIPSGSKYNGVLLFNTNNFHYGTNTNFKYCFERYNSNKVANGSSMGNYSSGNLYSLNTTISTGVWEWSNYISYNNSSDYIGLKFYQPSSTTYKGSLTFKFFVFPNTFNTDYFINYDNTFVPYSSVEQLQEAYDNLLQQYNDYVASHSYTDTQYNDLVSANSFLQQQLSTLQAQYDVYVATHTHTDTEYNNLLDGYDDLLDTQRELESDYNELQIAYNTMKVNYDTLNNAINYGIFAYIDGYNYGQVLEAGVFFYGNYNNSTYYIMPPSGSDYIWSFNDLIEEGLLESGGILRIDKITERSDYNSNVNYSCQIRLNHMPITSFYLDVQNMNGAYIQVRDYSATQRTVSFTTNSNEHVFTYQNIYSVDSQFNNEISDIIISPQFTSSSILGQAIGATASIQSYNNGYNDGVNFMSYYKNEYDIISREYESARRDIATLRDINESLNEQLSSGLGWKSLFFAMADTPLKTVSNVLGFELFGLNLFTTFIGMITVLGIVFLLKKLI